MLTRAPLEIYASFLRMRATGVHKLGEGERPPSEALAAKVRFSPKSFGRFAAGHNRFMTMSHLIAALPQSFVIDYAQINDEAALDALFGFVGSRARRRAPPPSASSTPAASRTASRTGGAAGLPEKKAPVLLAPPPPTHPLARAHSAGAPSRRREEWPSVRRPQLSRLARIGGPSGRKARSGESRAC